MTELAVIASNPTALDRLADPGEFVIQACERAKSWLAEALEHGDIEQIVELKSQAEAIRVYSAQKQIGHDAELSAAEIVRRAERGIGIAIRRGQQAGEIRKLGEGPGPQRDYMRGGQLVRVEPTAIDSRKSPTDFGVPSDELARGAYALADGVTDERFDSAVAQARAEGNLSRANVVRKVKGENADVDTQPARRGSARRPLPDAFRDVTHTAMKAAESIQRLTKDDRWSKNAPKIDPITRGNLRRAIELLSAAADSLTEGAA